MKKYLILATLIGLITTIVLANDFDNRGVWKCVNAVSLAKNKIASFGLINVSDRESDLNLMAIGTSGDSLRLTIAIYGQMSYSLTDTTKSVLIQTKSDVGQYNITLCDTLIGSVYFPYLWGKITNTGDSTAVVTAYLYMKPKETNVIPIK